MTPAHVVLKRIDSGAYSRVTFVGWYGVRIDAARVIEDADQNMGHHGLYEVAGYRMHQVQALNCAHAVLRPRCKIW